MKIAIVGAEENKWTEKQKEKAKDFIRTLLCEASQIEGAFNNKEVILVSGHSPKGGVDVWAENIAKELGIKTEIYAPEVNQWNDKWVSREELTIPVWHLSRPHKCPKCGYVSDVTNVCRKCNELMWVKLYGYRSRNIQIAEACDVLYDIEPAHSCRYCKGTGIDPKSYDEHIFTGFCHVIAKNCKFCKGDGAYSGGTWTLKYTRKLGKEVHKVIIK